MAAIDQVVKINISQQTKAVAQASFAIPLIVGPTDAGWDSDDYVHAYAGEADALLDDGFTTSDPEYAWALALNSQPIAPSQFLVGRRKNPVAQVNTFAVNTADTAPRAYAFTLNGHVVTYTSTGSDTQQAILGALRTAAIATGLVTGAVTGTGGSALLTLTASSPGQVLTYTGIDTHLTALNPTPAAGIAADLASIMAQDNTWYGWMLAEGSDADILQAAAWTEAQQKMFFACSPTAAIGDPNSTTDIMAKLKAASYARSPLLWSPGASSLGAEAAWVGGQLPKTPGSNTWAFKTLAGIPADTFTDTQIAAAIGNAVAGTNGKNANIHSVVGGVPITRPGKTPDGGFIDTRIGLDWLQSTMQAYVFAYLVNSDKVPYTAVGTTVLMSGVRRALDEGVTNGFIDGASISISAQKVADVAPNKRAQRIAPDINWACRLQGAIHAVTVQGTVTV